MPQVSHPDPVKRLDSNAALEKRRQMDSPRCRLVTSRCARYEEAGTVGRDMVVICHKRIKGSWIERVS
jgi:hypothetical protein